MLVDFYIKRIVGHTNFVQGVFFAIDVNRHMACNVGILIYEIIITLEHDTLNIAAFDNGSVEDIG